ncbi:hypothetical protein T484DRAFT_2781370 [Baffinella frigidus]|nr:hypothetical protein T484DRAFT_2781370 [Cryptophyta sp. CCMP2293]
MEQCLVPPRTSGTQNRQPPEPLQAPPEPVQAPPEPRSSRTERAPPGGERGPGAGSAMSGNPLPGICEEENVHGVICLNGAMPILPRPLDEPPSGAGHAQLHPRESNAPPMWQESNAPPLWQAYLPVEGAPPVPGGQEAGGFRGYDASDIPTQGGMGGGSRLQALEPGDDALERWA